MVKRFLDNSVTVRCNKPCTVHVQFNRAFVMKDGIVHTSSFDETELDKVSPSNAPSITDYIKSGEMPPKLGTVPSINGLSDAEYAERWLAMFNRAGRTAPLPAPAAPAASAAPAAPAASAAPAAPVAPVAPVEPQK